MDVQQNYFNFSELIATDTGLPNYPTSPVHLANLAYLWRYLNSLREELGQPIIVNSAFRTDSVNEQVGGTKCSYHKQGRAADICTSPLYMYELLALLSSSKDLGVVKELKVYPTFYHFSI